MNSDELCKIAQDAIDNKYKIEKEIKENRHNKHVTDVKKTIDFMIDSGQFEEAAKKGYFEKRIINGYDKNECDILKSTIEDLDGYHGFFYSYGKTCIFDKDYIACGISMNWYKKADK